MIITRNVCIPSALEFSGNVRAEILDWVGDKGPEEFSYDVKISNFTKGREATRFDPPEPAEYEHDAHTANVAGDILARLIIAHGDIITMIDARDIVTSILAFEEKWIKEHLDGEVYEAQLAESEYWEEKSWERESY